MSGKQSKFENLSIESNTYFNNSEALEGSTLLRYKYKKEERLNLEDAIKNPNNLTRVLLKFWEGKSWEEFCTSCSSPNTNIEENNNGK